jgi:hypothetical protein
VSDHPVVIYYREDNGCTVFELSQIEKNKPVERDNVSPEELIGSPMERDHIPFAKNNCATG